MKTNTRAFSAMLLILSFLIVSSCRKKSQSVLLTNNLTSFDSLKLSNVHYKYNSGDSNQSLNYYSNRSLNYRIVYLKNGKVDSMIITDELGNYLGINRVLGEYFVYTNNGYNILPTDTGRNISITGSVRLNNKGLILSAPYTVTVIYDGTEVSSRANFFVFGESYNYYWSGGNVSYYTSLWYNLVCFACPGPIYDSIQNTYYFTYNSSQKGQVGDAFQIDDFLTYGKSIVRSLNVPQGVGISYAFDNMGRITRFTEIDANNDTSIYD